MEDKPVINFGTTIQPGEKKSITHKFDSSGYLTHLHARAYPGEDRSVERRVFLWRGGRDNGNPIPVMRSPEGADEFLSGQDETWKFDMRRGFGQHDELEVQYRNTGDYAYPCSLVVTVEHERSLLEKLGGLL